MTTISHDDRLLIERHKTHLAAPHIMPHPGQHLRAEWLLGAEAAMRRPDGSSRLRSASTLTPPPKTIPPDAERIVRAALRHVAGELTADEALELDRYLAWRVIWTPRSEPYNLAKTIANLLFRDRLRELAEKIDPTIDPRIAHANGRHGVRLALGHRQYVPDETETLVYRILGELGVELTPTQRSGLKYMLMEHSWSGDVTAYSIAAEVIRDWISEQLNAFRERRAASARLSSAAAKELDERLANIELSLRSHRKK